MNIRFTSILLLIIGFSFGWLGRDWWLGDGELPVASQDVGVSSPSLENRPLVDDVDIPLNNSEPLNVTAGDGVAVVESNQSVRSGDELSTTAMFEQLLDAFQYQAATVLYQEQDLRDGAALGRLRALLLKRLDTLMTAREYTRFSELVDAFLSVYYDDVEVLLQLAEFNYSNGFYIEAVNVFQLVKTYAYSTAQQQLWFSRFDEFVNAVDQYYSGQEDWFSLSGFYSHIDVLGLLSASYQYRQAIAYLNSGDESGAIARLKPLIDDSKVGDKARLALSELEGSNLAASAQDNPFRDAKSVALQQAGNQYLVDLQINRRDDVTLLIDTGASMTTLSRSAFLSLSSRQRARLVGKRVFQTANGVTQGSVYRVDQLRLGAFQLSNVDIAVLDFSLSSGVEGLLGMNVLGQFRFQIDQDNVSLLLNEK